MKRTWLLRDFIIFKRGRAKARSVILEAKSSSWRQFCTSLTSTTNLSQVWKVIKSFSGNRPPCFIPTLLAQGISAKNKQHKSNVLANQFALSSSSANYRPRFVNVFLPTKTRLLPQEFFLATPIDPRVNQAFTLEELISAVQDAKNTTPRADNLCYEMFKRLSTIIGSHAAVVQQNLVHRQNSSVLAALHRSSYCQAKSTLALTVLLPANIPYQQCVQTLWKNGRMSTQLVFGVPQDP